MKIKIILLTVMLLALNAVANETSLTGSYKGILNCPGEDKVKKLYAILKQQDTEITGQFLVNNTIHKIEVGYADDEGVFSMTSDTLDFNGEYGTNFKKISGTSCKRNDGIFKLFKTKDTANIKTKIEAQKQADKQQKTNFVLIPAGSFQMGDLNQQWRGDSDEKPVHSVTIAQPFYMSKTEITQKQWQAVMGNNPSKFKGANHPVEKVSWDDIQTFIKKLNQLTGKTHRLPSEAEWEYAARAGSTTKYSWGNRKPSCNKSAANGTSFDGGKNSNCYYKPNGNYRGTEPVASYQANAFGLYDMAGNVWEWTQDCWNDSYNNAPNDGSAWLSGNCARRVLRGGSWNIRTTGLRPANRNEDTTSNRNTSYGFRLIQDR